MLTSGLVTFFHPTTVHAPFVHATSVHATYIHASISNYSYRANINRSQTKLDLFQLTELGSAQPKLVCPSSV